MPLNALKNCLRLKSLTSAGLAAACIVVGALGYLAMKAAGNQMLEVEARIDAARWSTYLSSNIHELSDIANGVEHSPEAEAFLARTLTGEFLVSFQVYDNQGYLKLDSRTRAARTNRLIAETDPKFAPFLAAGKDATRLQEDQAAGANRLLAAALVPILSGGERAGWLVVNLDQTERRALFDQIIERASLGILLLLIAAPAFGFWYHARNKDELQKTLAAMSQRDRLTGFMVKPAVLDIVDKHLQAGEAGESRPPCALILCELSGAAVTAGAYGQNTEETMIRLAAERLASIVAGNHVIGMAGRASFLIFVKNAADPMEVLSFTREITRSLGTDMVMETVRLASPCHAGIAMSSTDGRTSAELMRSAEHALVSAREQGTPGYGFYNPDLAKDSARRLAVQKAVAAAAAERRFRLDFQPVYNIRTGELNGFEALIRLHDDELGNISPAEFIPIAEQAGFINQIGAWALDEAARTAAEWPPHLMVAVNLSPAQFLSGTLVTDIRRALENNNLPSYRLEVEITEGTLMNDSELVLGQLRVLRDMGVAIALDDFGTGYSSLSYLWKFPFSKLKIDRSFVNALGESASAKGILRSIIKLGHGLGLTVTAEGIENSRQLTTLRDLGCDLAQGYLLDRPARVADLAAIILRNFANGLNRRIRESNSDKSAA